MSTAEHDPESSVETAEETPRKLKLDVQISDVGPCKKHLKVVIPREEVEQQFEESLGDLRKEAMVPGFRPGHAPRTLVQKRFRKEVAGQVKSKLLMACMEQLDEYYKLNPISQPNFDVEAIDLPEDGPMQFEMDLEVQPDFALPAYKSLSVKRPVKEINDADVDAELKTFLERYAQLVPRFEGGAEIGDIVTVDLIFHRDGQTLNEAKEIQLRLQPELQFQDGRIPDLAEALVGSRPGDRREARAEIGSASANSSIRGQTIGVTINVLDLKTLRLPEVNAAFLQSIGFDDENALREALRGVLERRVRFQQRQIIRRSILDQLLKDVDFDLPPDLVARQEKTNLHRQVMEMRQAGLGDRDIRAREAQIRANAHEQTTRSLKEFFLLSKIADAEGLKVEDSDLEQEIEAIAARTDETSRRVRARIEKEGLAEGLATQVLERKTIDRILEYVRYEEVPMVEERAVETLDQTAAPASAEGEDQGEAAEAESRG